MDGYSPLLPGGNTFLIPAATTAPTGVQATGPTGRMVPFVFWNAGVDDAFISYEETAAAAQTAAVIPTAGNPSKVLVVPGRAMTSYTLKGGMYMSGIVATTAGSVFVTPGSEGA